MIFVFSILFQKVNCGCRIILLSVIIEFIDKGVHLSLSQENNVRKLIGRKYKIL